MSLVKPSNDPSLAVSADGLRKVFSRGWFGGKPVEALKGLTLSVARGEIFGLLGQNGAGKTTFIKILLGIVRRSAGDATILGLPAGKSQARRRVGYLPENMRVPKHLTATTALEYFGGLSGMAAREIRVRADELLEMVGLSNRRREPVTNFSKGMMQRLGLAQALLHDPDLLILDEPTDGLDPVARKQVRELLTDLKARGKTIFLNSHIMQEVELVCDRVAILHQGELKRLATIPEITAAHQSAEGLIVTFDVAGPWATIQQALGEKVIRHSAALDGANHQRVEAQLPDQASIDQALSRLLQAGLSVTGLARKRETLENVFVEIVRTTSQGVAPDKLEPWRG